VTRIPSPSPEPGIARKLALVALHTDSAVVIGDAAGCVEWVNPAFTRLTGFSPEEVLGKRLTLIARDEETRETALDYVLTRFLRGEAAKLELPGCAKSGRPFWVDLEVQPIRAGNDEEAGFMAIATEITERKEAAQALAESEERYRQLVELSPDPIAVHCDGRIVFVNPSASILLGAASPDELVGRPVMDFVHPDSRRSVTERIQKMLSSGQPVELLEEKIVRLDDRTVDVEVAGAPITFHGKQAVQLVARDVTARKQAEAERRTLAARLLEAQHSESLGTLAQGLAHDFNNLLETILGEADLGMLESSSGSTAEENLRSIRRAALRAAELTGQLLAYAGKGSLARARIDLSALVMQTSTLLDGAVRRREALSYDLTGSLPPVLGDPVQLRQVLLSLVRNAGEAMEGIEGTVTVRTELETGEDEPGAEGPKRRFVRLDVVDHGCGLDAETRSRACEPFFGTRFAGRGLGLAAVKGIVESHRGEFRISSDPGRGTTATVLLPCEEISGTRRRKGRKTERNHSGQSILVVDDEEGPRSVAQRVVEREG
jgi:PAS domain S-box-containing protein